MDGPVRMVGVLLFLWVNQTVVSVLGIPATVLLFGEIRTPNYPKAYPEYNRTVWELAVPKGFLLKLTFKYFNVMYDRGVLGKFCGQEGSPKGQYPGREPIKSPGNSLKVIFQSDISNQETYLGFLAHYQAIDIDECSQLTNEDEGQLCQHLCHNVMGGYFCSCHHGYQIQPDKGTCEVNETVMPLCLPTAGSLYQPGVMGYVSGWGITERYKLSNQLKYVALPVVDQHQCNASIYRSQHATKDIPQLTDYMFCAGRVEGGEDTCSGDSGGAFTLLRGVEGGGEEYYAAGIVSWGMDCGKKGNYGVYTRVERYLGWINQTIQGN
ncbi:UNVERIFIED_CONTAM: hypothetical protein FKN15_007838 [Acipenser sinensis]